MAENNLKNIKENTEVSATYEEAAEKSTKYKVAKVSCFAWCLMSLGLQFGLLGPTLQDLKNRLNVDYQLISYGLAALSAGYSTGGIAAGLTLDRLQNQGLVMAAAASLVSACLIGIGYTSSIYVFVAMCFFDGFGFGIIETGIGKEVIQLFTTKASIPTHLIRFAFSVGGLVAPTVASVFLSPDLEDIDIANFNSSTAEPVTSQIEYAYTISAGVLSTSALCYTSFYIYDQKYAMTSTPKPKSSSCTAGVGSIPVSHITVIFLASCMTFLNSGGTFIVKFATSFAVECDLEIPIERAALLPMIFWISSAVTRLVGAVMSNFVRPRVLIIYQLACLVASAIVITIYGNYVELALWVAVSLGGLGQGISYANAVSFANEYVEVNACIFMFFSVFAGIGGLTINYVTGLLFDITPMAFAYVSIAYCCCVACIFVAMETTACVISRQAKGDYKVKNASRNEVKSSDQSISMY